MPVQQLTLSEAQSAIANLWGTDWPTMAARMSEYGLTPAEMANTDFLRQWSGGAVEPIYAKNGETILGYNFRAESSAVGTGLNSNTNIIRRGYVGHAPATTIQSSGPNAGKVVVSRLSGIGSKVVTAASKLAIPLTLASIGITLGKTIDETLYNANPDFWDSIGLETLNPQTWSSIAGGDDTLGGSFINALFGIDPQTGETQPYIDANALAYMSYCLNQAGVFATGGNINFPSDSLTSRPITTILPASNIVNYVMSYYATLAASVNKGFRARNDTSDGIIQDWVSANNGYGNLFQLNLSKNGSGFSGFSNRFRAISELTIGDNFVNGTQYTCDGVSNPKILQITFYDMTTYIGYIASIFNGTATLSYNYTKIESTSNYEEYGTTFNATIEAAIEGIGNQPNATIPNFDGLSESDYLPYLQQTYPDMFNNAIDYPVVQPDGTIVNHKYVPITLPDSSTMTNTQPVSGNQTQAQPSIEPATATDTLTQLLTKLLQQPMTEPISDTPNPPQNPTDTGDGSSPIPYVPVGSASALWKIYHPTQAQIDSFGGWLWSSNFIDQILKIFNNPMEAVIGLHKVYATPIDAGNATIKVGYLDSQVPSAYIEQQYINVDCGSVNLFEQFGNVFDYSPYTDVQLYLPFVGIVPLNVADVMRSTISINYGVDVITGACLAQVEVSRDGNASILYQYSGNCAVQYPISSGSYMGIVSSIISVAGGVAATVASGGAAAPLALGAAGGLLNAHTSVQHSGGFSGNSGAMGGKIPYLIITRPQTKIADNSSEFMGYPANDYVTIGECSGYIKANYVHIINVNATDEELTEINNLLLSGIII